LQILETFIKFKTSKINSESLQEKYLILKRVSYE